MGISQGYMIFKLHRAYCMDVPRYLTNPLLLDYVMLCPSFHFYEQCCDKYLCSGHMLCACMCMCMPLILEGELLHVRLLIRFLPRYALSSQYVGSSLLAGILLYTYFHLSSSCLLTDIVGSQ